MLNEHETIKGLRWVFAQLSKLHTCSVHSKQRGCGIPPHIYWVIDHFLFSVFHNTQILVSPK